MVRFGLVDVLGAVVLAAATTGQDAESAVATANLWDFSSWGPGTWANSVTALATTLAAIAAGIALCYAKKGASAATGQLRQLQADAERRAQVEEASQARRIYWQQRPLVSERASGSLEWGTEFIVVNASDEPIMAVFAAAFDPLIDTMEWNHGLGVLWPGVEKLAAQANFTDVHPKGVRASIPRVPQVECQEATFWRTGVAFRDATGTWWFRYPDMTLAKFSGLPGSSLNDDREAMKQELASWWHDHQQQRRRQQQQRTHEDDDEKGNQYH